MSFLQIICVAIAGILVVSITKKMDSSISIILIIAVGIILIILSTQYILDIIKVINALNGQLNINLEYFVIIIKAIVIAYITEFVAEFAVDNGQSSIASKVELVGKLAIFYISLPVITSIFSLITELL